MTTRLEDRDKIFNSIFQLWLNHLDTNILKRASIMAFIIGSILILSNQSGAVFGDDSFKQPQLMLAFLTPFLVVTLSQLVAIQRAIIDRSYSATTVKATGFFNTIINHNIPFRAIVISLIIGSLSSVIILINTIFQTGDITNTPLPLLVQSYLLPLIFGALSQTLTYRRHVGLLAN